MMPTKATTKTILLVVTVMALAAFLPGFVITWIGWGGAAGYGTLAAVSCLIASASVNWRLGFALAPPLAIAAALATAFNGNPWLAAALMAVATFARGLTAAKGMSNALVMAPIALAFITAEPTTVRVSLPAWLAIGLAVLGAGLYASVFPYLLRKRLPKPTLTPVSPSRARGFAVVSGAVVGIATWVVVHYDLGHGGAWLLLTLLVVLQPFVKDAFKKTAHRVLGTTVGFVIAFAIASVITWPAALYAIGVTATIGAVAMMLLHRPYWRYASFLTVAIVLLEGASSSVLDLDVVRLWATIAGSAIALAVTAIAAPIAKRRTLAAGGTHY